VDSGELHVIRDGALTGERNMAVDAALLERHRPGDPPVLRLYRWEPPAVSFGYNQREQDFDPARVAAHRFDLVRRPTGGRAILHAEEITYAVIGDSPSDLFGPSLHSTYMKINEALVAFLRGLGYAAEISGGEERHELRGAVCFKSAGQHEIRIGGQKLVGSAQRRRGGRFLQHGSLLTGPQHAALVDCLVPERRSVTKEQLLALTTDLGRLQGRPATPADLGRWEDALVAAFAATFDLAPVPVTLAV